MTEHSSDYHDYVIRDGKLIGEFEEMYRHSAGVPWHQHEQEEWVDVRLTVEMLKDVAPFDEVHDLGCGLGYYLALMRKHVGSAHCLAIGYDISATACAQARVLFPDSTFRCHDLTTAPPPRAQIDRPAPRRLLMIRGTLWYVFPRLDNVVNAIRGAMSDGDKLLVVQNFPPLESHFVGKDVIPDHHALMRHFARCFAPLRHVWYQDAIKTANDNWFIGLFSPGHMT